MDQSLNFDWEGQRVLVTGAGGFIASHLIESLVRKGAKVHAFVRYNSRGDPGLLRLLPKEVLRHLHIIGGDLRDPQAVTSAMRETSLVYHLGALIGIPYSFVHPTEVIETNIMGTLNVLLAARECQVERVIHTSSSEVYGTAQYVPIDETHPLQGQSPYSASKIGADKIVESFYRAFDLPVVTLRPFNTYGPRQSARAVIPTIITQALTRQEIHLGNLVAKRDLTYVSDTVDGFIKVAEKDDIEGETLNLGTGNEITIGKLAKEIIALVDRKVEIVTDPTRLRPTKSEVVRLQSDNRRACELLDWNPVVNLQEGLQRTIAWIETHLDHYQPDHYLV